MGNVSYAGEKLGNFGGRRGTLLARRDKTLLRDYFSRLTRKTSKAVLCLSLYEEMQADSRELELGEFSGLVSKVKGLLFFLL